MKNTTMIEELISIARVASEQILAIYNSGASLGEVEKGDGSPLTEADRRANEIIVSRLRAEFASIPILSEEQATVPWEERKGWNRFFLVDPLDGTREFIKRNGDFTVNIALIENGAPVAGVVHIPVTGVSYFAESGRGAYRSTGSERTRIFTSKRSFGDECRIVGSRSHASPGLQTILADIPLATLVSRGSALKLCMVAEGSAEIYPRHGPTSLWDIAAGQCVINESGGVVVDARGNELTYGKNESILNPPFIALNSFDPRYVETFSRSMSESK